MTERMTPPTPTGGPPMSGKALWAARLRGFGQSGLTVVLLVIAALWMHELFTDPAVRQGWKLKVLMFLIPLAVLAVLSLGAAWVLLRPAGEKR